MIAALIRKELRQHWLPFLLLALLLGLGFLMLLAVVVVSDEGSVFETLRRFLIVFVPIAALVLGNRLVVREYQSKTQLFLESLPLSRSRMVAVKYLFGLGLLVVVVGTGLATLVPLAARSEPLTGPFLLILAARSLAYTWCVYSFFFVMGLLGRYRVAIYLLAVFGAAALETQTSIELKRFGPFALLNDRFAYERAHPPTEDLLLTMGLAAACLGLALLLSLIREGSVATLVAEKMSHREKVFVTVLLLALVFTLSVYEESAQKKPFDLPGAVVQRRGEVTVKVSLGAASRGDQAGRQLAATVAGEIAALQAYLDVRELPPIFIVQRRDLDADRYERGVLDGAEGLLVRANFLSDNWQESEFLAWLVRELLIVASHERLQLEHNAWLLDGFGPFWSSRGDGASIAHREQLELRAAQGVSQGFSADDVNNWFQYRERVGEKISAAVSWSGLVHLQRERGEDACRAFLRAALDSDVPGDVRATLHDWRHPPALLLERKAGLAFEPFVAGWIAAQEETAKRRADELADVPTLSGELTFAPLSDATRMVMYDFRCQPPPASGRFRLLHAKLPAFDAEVPDSEIEREDLDYQQKRSGDLPATFARGARFYSTFAVHVESLGCDVITGWTRREIE